MDAPILMMGDGGEFDSNSEQIVDLLQTRRVQFVVCHLSFTANPRVSLLKQLFLNL